MSSREFRELEPVILKSRNEAHAFYEAHRDAFSSRAFTFDNPVPFIRRNETLLDNRFDDHFFEEHALVFIPFIASEIWRYSVTNIELNDGVMEVEIEGTGRSRNISYYFIVSICRSLVGNEIRLDFTLRSPTPTPTVPTP